MNLYELGGITSYKFSFTKRISGYKTSDDIEVYIFFSTGSRLISFDLGQFANVTKLELDEAKMLKTLDEYVKRCINTEKYKLVSYTIENQTLTYVDGKLCNVYTICLNLHPWAISDIESVPMLETIGIFCE